ncbi:unnamed protein product [Symbiodinium sp. CCMP2592]|nr:unnamed protein product [Symbiodinium sp. CCMP2592]
MINAGFAWATANGLVRKNPVHQEEEAKLVISETFELQDQQGTEINLSGSFELEDDSGFLLSRDGPSIDSSLADIARGGTSDAAPEEAPTAGQAASFKLVFPTLAQNASATSLLASFLEVLGRKIDACEDIMDKLDESQNSRASSLRDQMKAIVTEMKAKYDDLTAKQAESVTTTPDKAFNEDLLRKYADITKQDVVLGNYVIRARTMTKKGGSSKAPSMAGAPKSKASEKKPKDKKTKKEKSEKKRPSDSEFDDDLADELFIGFEQGAESATRVTRLANVANNKLKKHGVVSQSWQDDFAYPVVVESFQGCGKGHDTAVLAAWIHDEIEAIDPTTIDEGYASLAMKCAKKQLPLFYMRPKHHMQLHLVSLAF